MLPLQALDFEHVAQTQLYAAFSCLCLPCSWPHKFCQYVFVPLSQHPSASRTCPHHTSSLRLSNDLAARIKDQTYSSLLIKYFQLRLLTLSNCIFNEDYVLYLWSPSMCRQEDSVWAWTASHTRQHRRVGPKGPWLPTEGNDHEARLASSTCKPLPGELPSPSVSQLPVRCVGQLEGDWRYIYWKDQERTEG